MATLHRSPTPTDRLCPRGGDARQPRRDGMVVQEARVALLVLDGGPIRDSHRTGEHLAWRRATGR